MLALLRLPWSLYTACLSARHPLFLLGINEADSLLPNTRCVISSHGSCVPCSGLVPLISLKCAGVFFLFLQPLVWTYFYGRGDLLEINPGFRHQGQIHAEDALESCLVRWDIFFVICEGDKQEFCLSQRGG